jgi:hypothetical protein
MSAFGGKAGKTAITGKKRNYNNGVLPARASQNVLGKRWGSA